MAVRWKTCEERGPGALELSAGTTIPAVHSSGLISQLVREKCARCVQHTLYFSQAVKWDILCWPSKKRRPSSEQPWGKATHWDWERRLPLPRPRAAGHGHVTALRPQPTQCSHVQENEAGTITNLQVRSWRPDGRTYYWEVCFCWKQDKMWGRQQSSYTPNSTAAGRNLGRRPHSSCRPDSQCSGNWEEVRKKERVRPFLIGLTFALWTYFGVIIEPKFFWRIQLVLNWLNFCFVNLVRGIRQTAMELCSGSKKLCSTCSGNIGPVRRTLPPIGWEQRPLSCGWGRRKNKNGWQCWCFTRFGGNWPICQLVGGRALPLGPSMI